MALADSISTALFCMAVVFAVLILLWGIIRAFSIIIKTIEDKTHKEIHEMK